MTTRNAQAIGHQHRRRSIVDRVRRPVVAAAAFIASLVIGSVVCLTLVATFPLLIGWSSAAIASGFNGARTEHRRHPGQLRSR